MTVALVIGLVLLTGLADYFLKVASSRTDWHATVEFHVAAVLYVMTAVGFLVLMRHMSLASLSVWFSLLSILLMTALGVFVFGESVTAREVGGILMAFGALGLMSRFA